MKESPHNSRKTLIPVLIASLASPSVVDATETESTVSRKQYCATVGATTRKEIARALAETAELSGGFSMRLSKDQRERMADMTRKQCLRERDNPNGQDRKECAANAELIASLIQRVLADSTFGEILFKPDRRTVAVDAIRRYEQDKCLRARGLHPL